MLITSLIQVAQLRVVPSSMTAASGGKTMWLRPNEVIFLDDSVARCEDSEH